MKAVKRIEIVTASLEMPKLIQKLERVGVSGYTLLRDVEGRGHRGISGADELTDTFKNSYLLIACPEDQLETILREVRPIVKRFGGICLVSDAQWVIH